jgi:hypothetical protein
MFTFMPGWVVGDRLNISPGKTGWVIAKTLRALANTPQSLMLKFLRQRPTQ